MNSNKMSNNNDVEEARKNIMMMIPPKCVFERMLRLALPDIESIIGPKPVLKHSQLDVNNMSEEECNAAFDKSSSDAANWELSAYDKFVEWNRKCLLVMSDEELKHLEWLCGYIAKGNVRNVDMECCGEFSTEGIYFNKDRNLVVCNGR